MLVGKDQGWLDICQIQTGQTLVSKKVMESHIIAMCVSKKKNQCFIIDGHGKLMQGEF